MFDNVTYDSPENLPALLTEDWDLLISSRAIEVLQYPWKARVKLFWSHDLPDPAMMGHTIRAHKLVFLTEFHAEAWHTRSREVFSIIGDGVDLSLFEGPELTRNENILVWTSNPDRGLCLAAKIFHDEILPRWPEMEFHIFGRSSVYGWPAENEGPFLPREEHMQNVFLHEPLTKAGLAKMLREAWALLYPTYWPETYCIATLEAQAAGTPIIASPYAGLNETVQGGVLTYDFVNAISQLRNKNRWEKLSKAGKEYAAQCGWDQRADQWLSLYETLAQAVATADAGQPTPPMPTPTPEPTAPGAGG